MIINFITLQFHSYKTGLKYKCILVTFDIFGVIFNKSNYELFINIRNLLDM